MLLSVAFSALLRIKSVVDLALGTGFLRTGLLIVGLATLLTAASLLVVQTDFKRMLAYSSMENMGLVAVAAGIVSLVRYREISPRNLTGKVYVITTVLTCLTGFGIFQHGGFGKPHALGIITLVVLGVAALAGNTKAFGHASRYVETISYSATFLFHLIPGITETTTRLPLGAPLLSSPEAPDLQVASGVLFVFFLIGAALQARRMHAHPVG